MKQCALCGKRFKPRRAAARYCSVECRQRAYRQRQQEAEPRYRFERSLLTAIRELRSGRPAAALMTIRLAVDDFEHAHERIAESTGAGPTKRSVRAAKTAAQRRATPPGPPPQRSARPRGGAQPPGPPPKRASRAAAATPDEDAPPTQRSFKPRATRARTATAEPGRGAADPPIVGAPLKPYSDLHARYAHVLKSGMVTQAEIARRLGLADGSPLSRWRRGGPLGAERLHALDEVVAQYEWEIFAGETLA